MPSRIGATSARSTLTGRPISISYGRPRRSTSTIPIGRSGHISSNCRRRSSCSTMMTGAQLKRSLLFSSVRVNSYAQACDAVVLPEVQVGRYARLTKVVVDRGVRIPENLIVGEDPELDGKRFYRSDEGVVLVSADM